MPFEFATAARIIFGAGTLREAGPAAAELCPGGCVVVAAGVSASRAAPLLADLEPVQHWAGLRPGSPANIPIIDRHPDFDNVFVNAGHYRYGVTMAPASAELLADLLESRTPAFDPSPYRWQAALERSWDEAS